MRLIAPTLRPLTHAAEGAEWRYEMLYFVDVYVPRSNSGIFARYYDNRPEAERANAEHNEGRCQYVATLEVTRVGYGFRVSDPESRDGLVTIYADGHSWAIKNGSVVSRDGFGCPVEGAREGDYLPYFRALEKIQREINDRRIIAEVSERCATEARARAAAARAANHAD